VTELDLFYEWPFAYVGVFPFSFLSVLSALFLDMYHLLAEFPLNSIFCHSFRLVVVWLSLFFFPFLKTLPDF